MPLLLVFLPNYQRTTIESGSLPLSSPPKSTWPIGPPKSLRPIGP